MSKDRAGQLGDLLSAYLDGELDEAARAEVAALLLRDPAVARLLTELRESQGLLKTLPRERAPAGFEQDVLAAVERRTLLGEETQPRGHIASRRHLRPLRAAAAVVLLVGGAGLLIFWQVQRNQSRQLADASHTRDELAAPARQGPARPPRASKAGPPQSAAEAVASARPATEETGLPKAAPAVTSGGEDSSTRSDIRATTDGIQDPVALFGDDSPLGSQATLNEQKRTAVFSAPTAEARQLAQELLDAEPADDRVELTLNFPNESALEQYARQIDADLLERGYLNADDPIHRTQIVDPLTQNVFTQSLTKPGASRPAERQYVVSTPPEMIEALVDRLAPAAPVAPSRSAPETIEVQVGGVNVVGAENARVLARDVAAKKQGGSLEYRYGQIRVARKNGQEQAVGHAGGGRDDFAAPAALHGPVAAEGSPLADSIQQGPPAPESPEFHTDAHPEQKLSTSEATKDQAATRPAIRSETKRGSGPQEPRPGDQVSREQETQTPSDLQSERQLDARAQVIQRKQSSGNAILLLRLKAGSDSKRGNAPATQPVERVSPGSGG